MQPLAPSSPGKPGRGPLTPSTVVPAGPPGGAAHGPAGLGLPHPLHRLHDCGQVPSCLSLGFLICKGGTLSRILKRCWEAWTSQRSRSAGLEAGLGGHTIGHSPHHPSPSHKPALPLSSPAPFSPAPRGPGSFSLSPHPVPYRIPWPCDTAGAGLRVWCRRGGLIQQGLPPSPPRRTGSCTPTGSCDVSCQ